MNTPIEKINFAQSRLQCFAVLWALVGYFEQIASFITVVSPVDIFAIFIMFCRPGSLTALIFLLTVNFAHTYLAGNHLFINNVMLTAFFDFTILLVVLFYILKRKSLHLKRGDIYLIFAPAIRVTVLIFYFFVAFAKLNTDYLDPKYSCAAFFVRHIHHWHYPSLITWFSGLPWMPIIAIKGAVITEFLIPILLICRRTRPLGIILVFIFHLMIGISPLHYVLLFSMLMLSLQFVFLSDAAFVYMHRWISRINSLINTLIPTPLIRYMAIAMLIYVPPFFIPKQHHTYHGLTRFDFIVTLWLLAYLSLGFIYMASIYRAWQEGRALPDKQPQRNFYISRPLFPSILAIIFAMSVGVSPYLGKELGGGFVVFANFVNPGSKTSHLIIPASLSIFHGPPAKLPTTWWERKFFQNEGTIYIGEHCGCG